MRITLITESAFGNTRAIADRLADGAREAGADVDVLDAATAPSALPAGTDLLVVAAPTHNGGLPSTGSRRIAAGQGAHPPTAGLREWISTASPEASVPVVALATTTNLAGHAGSAAKAAAKALRSRGFGKASQALFLVSGTPPVLAEGEAERALAAGRALVAGEPVPQAAMSTPAPVSGPARRPLWRRGVAALRPSRPATRVVDG